MCCRSAARSVKGVCVALKKILNCRAQALIEFILIVPLLLFVLVFAYYAFFTLSDYLTLQQMAREAARLGASDQQIAYLSNREKNTTSDAYKKDQALVLQEVNRFGTLHLYDLRNVTVSINAGRPEQGGNYVHAVLRMELKPEVPRIDGIFDFFPRQSGAMSGFPPPYLVYNFDLRPQRDTPGQFY